MDVSDFIGYVGGPDIHDGFIRAVATDNRQVRVTIEGASGQMLVIEFDDAAWVRSLRPTDMMLYAIAEWKGEGYVRRFVFANWDEEDEAFLEIGATGIQVAKLIGGDLRDKQTW